MTAFWTGFICATGLWLALGVACSAVFLRLMKGERQ